MKIGRVSSERPALDPSANRAGRARAIPRIKIPCRSMRASCASDAGRFTSSPHPPTFNSAGQARQVAECIGSTARLRARNRGNSERKECTHTALRTRCSEEGMPRRASTNSWMRGQLRAKRKKAGDKPDHRATTNKRLAPKGRRNGMRKCLPAPSDEVKTRNHNSPCAPL